MATSSFDHPFRDRPSQTFWKPAVAEMALGDFDPIVSLPFRIARTDRVATAGSCFAQHISRALMKEGLHFLQTEKADEVDAARLPVYSARYGNIYTCRQLIQLFQRAYGLFTPSGSVWRRDDGRYIDAFRPNEFRAGFATVEDVESETETHLAAVREVFEGCDVFVFTLGLTEVWLSDLDGSAVPLPPGVVGSPLEARSTFSPTNLTVQALSNDLIDFIDELRRINPKVRVLITVSPVPIIATFEDRHVIVSNSYTKAVLRVVANAAATERDDVLYFPSYEMIVTHPKAHYFDANFRAVRPEGVAAVMKVFRQRILLNEDAHDHDHAHDHVVDRRAAIARRPEPGIEAGTSLEREFKDVICDEDMLAQRIA